METLTSFSISLILTIVCILIVMYLSNRPIDKLYNSLNIGDTLILKKRPDYMAPWDGEIPTTKVIKKENRWIQIQYKNGYVENINFKYYNRSKVKRWRKINK